MGKKKFRKSKQGKGSGSLVSRAKQMRKLHLAHQARTQKQKKWQDMQVASKRERRRKNAFVPYSPSDFVLLVGEGNFSFARALARRFGGLGTRIVATSYDTREQVLAKYPDATEILEELNTAGVTVVHGVDATQLETNKDLRAAIATMMYVEDSSAGVSHANAGQVASHGDNGSSIDEVDATRAELDGSNNSGSDSESESESERADGDETASARRHRQRIDIFDRVVFNFPHTGCAWGHTGE